MMQQQQTLTEQDVNNLLNKNLPFDQYKVSILDKVITCMYGTDPNSIMMANKILQELKNDPEFWLATDIILANSQNNNTKFLSLVILEEAIKLKWNIIPENQQTAIKSYAMNMVISLGQQQNRDKQTESLLNKANSILVQIVKYEWNTKWRQFIPEICGSCMTNQNVCENNLHILKLLSEEIFDYSKNTMTSKQIKELKENMITEFKQIFDICYYISKQFITDPSQIKLALMKSCLETLYSFLSWVPINYIFQGDLIDFILIPLIDHPQLRILTIRCLTEISIIQISGFEQQDKVLLQEKVLNMYVNFINRINNVLPADIHLHIEWKKMVANRQSTSHFEDLSRHSALFLTEFFKTHIDWIEKQNYGQEQQMQFMDFIRRGLQYILEITQLPDDQIFKICIEFWAFLCPHVQKQIKDSKIHQQQSLLLLNNQQISLLQQTYPQIFVQLRKIVISRMAKPEEVLITTDEQGNAVRVQMENTENNSLYELMKDLLINLSLLDWNNMYQIMQEKLERQFDGSEFSFDNLNTLCWAIGSISGTLPENEEKSFLIMTIRILLNLCENKKGKENKATIASNIMYVVGQYPKFLRSNWNFLKTVIKKLFEFMHETFPGVMDMAVNTFLKISKQCKEEFVKVQHVRDDHASQNKIDQEPYIYDLIRNTQDVTSVLENKHRLVYYEALGYIIGAEKNELNVENMLANTIQELYVSWKSILDQGQQNINILKDEYNMDCLQFFLKVNERIAFSVGHQYHKILFKLLIELQQVYSFYSNEVNTSFLQNGKLVLNHTVIKRMRGVKKNILQLMQTYIEKSENPQFVAQNIQSFLFTVLNCYSAECPETREAEVLLCFASVIEKLNINLANEIPEIFKHIFQATLTMITQDFNSYPDHRINFFQFLKAVVIHAFPILYQVPPDQFKIMMDCILWAIKHDLPNIFDIGLDVLKTILDEVNKNPNIIEPFYLQYYMSILQEILYALTDSFHKNGFKMQTQILFILLQVVMSNYLQSPLPGNTNNMTNQEFVYTCITTSLSQQFTNISKQQTESYIKELFIQATKENNHENFISFKTILRDYLIQLSTFSTDSDALYDANEVNPNKPEQSQQQ